MVLQSTSSGVPTVPVLLVAAVAVIAFCPGVGSAAVENVVWTNIVNSTATGNSLQKAAGCDGCDDAGATSQQQITSGDGYIEFTIGEANTFWLAGLGQGNAGTAYTDIEFAFRLNGAGSADVMESGVYRGGDTSYAAGDVFRVEVVAGQVQYSKNGTPLYTSSQAPTYPLLLDSSLLSVGSTIVNAKISFAGGVGGAPGGFIESADSTAVRALLTATQIQALLPSRGLFTFPTPYNTSGVRLTNADDCGGNDCVHYVGYSYWKNMNNHVGSDTMYIFVGLDQTRGGAGPTLFSYNKVTDAVQNLGPLFGANDPLSWQTGEQWYWSATQPTKLYIFAAGYGSQFLRYDVATKQKEVVFDVAPTYGADKYIWQPHSSNDDNVHMVTLRTNTDYSMLGCVVYREDTKQFSYFPATGALDECNLTKDGRYLIMLEVTGSYGDDNLIIDLQTGMQTMLLDQNGAAGHLGVGYGVMVGEDNWCPQPACVRLYTFGQPFAPEPTGPGPVVYHATDWSVAGHVSFENATASTPVGQQYACNSYVDRTLAPRGNEIVCYLLNGNLMALIVAPVMTDLNATGGGSDDYSKVPKGNLDVTGQYFIWTSNMASSRLDAFIVKVPGQCLYRAPQQEGSC